MQKIEKIIHYCWFGENAMSKLHLRCVDSWKKYLPDYKIMRWDENNSPMENSYVKTAIRFKKMAFAADYVRLWALKEHGGIYMDTDMELIKNPESILDELEFFSGYEKIDAKLVSCGMFGTCKNSKIILGMLDYINKTCIPKRRFVTIPVIATHIVNQMPKSHFVKIFPYEYFYPYNPSDEQGDRQLMFSSITPNTYAIHHWENSWGIRSLQARIQKKLKKIFNCDWQILYEVI